MKRIVIFITLTLFLASLAIVSAIANPSTDYCIEKGYTYESINDTDICNFNDGNSCIAWNYFCKCSGDPEGACSPNMSTECDMECETSICDLNNLNLCLGFLNCTTAGGFWYNDICNVEEQTICTEEGEIYNVLSGGAGCCEGLLPIDGCGPDNNGNCGEGCGGGSICANCGNGECGLGENKCNCPKDCEIECTEDDDCEEGYKCDVGICILEEEDKVCCMRTLKKGKIASGYTYIDRTSCVSSKGFDAEIVENSLCITIKNQIKEAIQERNRLKFEERTGQECADDCTCTGRVMKCETEDGREMTVYAGSGNVIVQVKGINMTTTVTLYHHNKTLYGKFIDGEKPIKTPDEIKEKVRDRLKSKFYEEDIEIELDEDGEYKFRTRKKARLFWVIPLGESVEADIDAETGQFVKLKGPWWGWLANDVDEEITEQI